MPNSMVLLDLSPDGVDMEVQLPLNEFEFAFGHEANQHPDLLIPRFGNELKAYLLAHIHASSLDNRPWKVAVGKMEIKSASQDYTGLYHELVAHLHLTPPSDASTRAFDLHYDAIIHQVVTHRALVFIRHDWESGILNHTETNAPAQTGVIELDIVSNKVLPFKIRQSEGGLWSGFKGMVRLGMDHIAEGTDHLLFLLVLLLPAPLIASEGRWKNFGGWRYCLMRLLKITAAFTLGHSFTLLLGALGWVHLPSQLVEILIAFSIFVSAIHAIRPIFPQRESFIALGFGLVHGLAFAATLTNLNLSASQMVMSILGFNIGIEMMQLFVVGITVPWLIILSRNENYTPVRMVGACAAALISLAWMAERFTGQANTITLYVAQLLPYALWLIGGLALLALGTLSIAQVQKSK
jgi:hypothetical protein